MDERTDTVYVVNGTGNTVSVLNGARCNARVTRGCGKPVATIKVGKFPVAAAFNPATRTLYVASPAGQRLVINAARCNAVHDRRAAGEPVKTVNGQGSARTRLDVDVATDTVYAANGGLDRQRRHRVGDQRGHLQRAHRQRLRPDAAHRHGGRQPVLGSPSTRPRNTVYVANNNDGTVSVINGAAVQRPRHLRLRAAPRRQ